MTRMQTHPPYLPLAIAAGLAWPAVQRVQADRSHPVWKTIQIQCARIAEAERKQDLATLRAVYAPDFVSIQPNGERWDVERTLAYQANGLKQVLNTICLNGTITHMELEGDKAYITELWEWTRMQRMAGKVRRVQTSALYDETWSKTAAGWRRQFVENTRSCTALVDDKRIDISRPYDPEAPAYDPLASSPRQPLSDVLYATFKDDGVDAGLTQFRSLRGSEKYYVSEASLNALGYKLLGEKKTTESVAVFKLNTELYPRSANAFDSLGEASLAAGDKRSAVKNYRRSLTLDPKNDNAREVLRRLGR